MLFYSQWPLCLVRALTAEAVQTVDDLASLSARQLLTHKGVSRVAMNHVNTYLADRGLTLSGDWRHAAEPVPTPEAVSGVYFVRCGPFVKIGRASNIRARIQNAATFVPYPLHLVRLDACSVAESTEREAAYHQRFAAHHHQREWFRYEGSLETFLLNRWPA